MVGVSFLSTAFICLFISFILSELFLNLRYPRVIGQILTGIILSFPLFSIFFNRNNMASFNFLADLGLVFLMLLTGLTVNLKKMKSAERDSIIIAISCVVVPFFIGVLVMRLLHYDWIVSLIVGACLSLTAEGTTMEVLYDLNALRTKLGSIIISTGIIDDVFEIFFLSSLVIFLQNGVIDVGDLLLKLCAFTVIIYILFKILPLILRIINKDHDNIDFSSFSLTIIFGLLISSIASEFHLSIVLAALIAGILLNKTDNHKRSYKRTLKQLELVTFSLLIPFFFIKIGLNFDFESFVAHLPLVFLIILIAIAGKLIGAIIVRPLTELSFRQMHIVGWALNSRGLVELIIANFAYSNGLIPIEIFSALVAMAVITTLLFPITVKFLAKDRRVWYD